MSSPLLHDDLHKPQRNERQKIDLYRFNKHQARKVTKGIRAHGDTLRRERRTLTIYRRKISRLN